MGFYSALSVAMARNNNGTKNKNKGMGKICQENFGNGVILTPGAKVSKIDAKIRQRAVPQKS